MRKLSLAIVLLVLTAPAWAQFTTVSGTVIDPNGIPYSGGTITAQLITAGVTPTINGGSFAATGFAGLDTTGSFTMRLADNSVMLPNTLQWSFTVCSAKGTVNPAFGTASQCFTPAPITISGSSQSITSQLHAAALALTVPFSSSTPCSTCITGSGTANTLSLFTAPQVIGNSGLSEPSGPGNGLSYSGVSFTFTGAAGFIVASTPGAPIEITTSATTGSTQPGGFSVLLGSATGTGTGALLFEEAGPATSGVGGQAQFFGGPSSSGTGGNTTIQAGSSTTFQGGNLYLNAGPNLSNTNGDDGIIVFDTSQTDNMEPLYFPEVSFANLLVPIANPFALPTPSNNGAFHWCRTCNGAPEAAAQGSVAGGSSGHGALIYYDSSTPAWRVVTGIGGGSSTPAFPQTVTGGVSGGIPYFSNNTTESASALLAAGHVLLGGGAGTAPTSDTKLDDGATTANTLTYTGAGGIAATGAGGFISSNNGVGTMLSLAGNPTSGFAQFGGSPYINVGNTAVTAWSTGLINLASEPIGFASGNPVLTSLDTAYSRCSANLHCFGNGTAGDFSGTVKASGFNAAGSAGVSAGSFSAITAITTVDGIVTQLTGTSDSRLKTIVGPYQGGLDSILKITPTLYRWNADGQAQTGKDTKHVELGFIAQNLQHALPQAVTGSEKSKVPAHPNESYLDIADRPVIAALVSAVQEQQREIERLKKQLGSPFTPVKTKP